jgi:arylsulfatase A-like enzyme
MPNEIISRRSLLKTATTLAAAGSAIAAPTPPASSPNVLIILADDLGYGDLSSFGASDLHTPNIDALVTGGVRFNNFYTNSPVCSPTRAAILSGQYPDLVGVPGLVRTYPNNNWGYLSQDSVLLPTALKPAGYHSGIIGKWNLGLTSPNLPTERGFDSFHGFLGDMMDDYHTHLRHGFNYMRENNKPIDPQGHATDIFTNWSIDYLRARKEENRKFFLYLAYNAPHVPIQPPAEWLERVKQRDPSLPDKRAKMVALIEHLDFSIGRVVAALKENGQWDNTLVIFTSDNGGQLSAGATCGPFRGGKEDMYEGGIRVPLGIVWPGHIAAASHSDEVALTMDLYPTICDALQLQSPKKLNGASFLGAVTGKGPTIPGRDLIWVRREGGMRYQGQDYYAFRRGDWKILQNTPFEPLRLYNLREDPKESNDLTEREPKLHRELVAALMLHIQQAGRVPWQPPQ